MKLLHKLSLKVRLQITFLVIIVVLAGIILFITQKAYSKQMINAMYNAEYDSIKSRAVMLDHGLKQYDEITLQIYNDEDIRNILDQNSIDAKTQYVKDMAAIKSKLGNMIFHLTSTEINSIVIASPNMIYNYYDWSGFIETYKNSILSELEEHGGKLVVFDQEMLSGMRGTGQDSFAIGRMILNKQFQSLGYEVVFISHNFFKTYIKQNDITQNSSYYLVSDSNSVMYSIKNENIDLSLKELIEQIQGNNARGMVVSINGQRLLFTQYSSDYSNWKHISVIRLNDMTSTIIKTIERIITIVIAVVLISSIAVQLIVSSITKPIANMQQVTKLIGNGDPSLRLPHYNLPDIENLAVQFNQMLEKLNELMMENTKKQEELRKTEIQMLQAQINPHFLYNTLNSIRWLAIFNGQEQIKNQIDSLTMLLRAILSDTREEITLGQEITILKSYAEIMRIRYYNFELEYKIEEPESSYLVPKFVLQPIVENSIIHGFAELDKEGIVVIDTVTESDGFAVRVRDNGAGIDYEKIETIMQSTGKLNHIGIHNVDQRVKMMYGDQFGFSVTSEKGAGTTVVIHFPIRKGKGTDIK